VAGRSEGRRVHRRGKGASLYPRYPNAIEGWKRCPAPWNRGKLGATLVSLAFFSHRPGGDSAPADALAEKKKPRQSGRAEEKGREGGKRKDERP